ncbi:Bye1p LALA0_S02e02080g [Lachancea lanzarotensis]|uniref:Transcription factor BYE1 n=1 Tax=Lachancea lanzarotensis TaxID=1245769 RepID=A0A0C7MM09_9SACH|nr:uncharacterized protein LALA0_S02e02080g [Lachancea lanzarotensis]CEP60893.1 LALA0S02e02080g1_1 [Lachancea lanzarotensis]
MDETIRRSSRSNKGTNPHLQRQRQAELEYIKARKVQQSNEKPDEDKPEVVKCLVCGTTDENYDEDNDPNGDMIQCDTCNTWQHIKCMTGNESAEDIENYDCSLCSPSKYTNLTFAINPADESKRSYEKSKVDNDQKDYTNDGLENISEGTEEEVSHRPIKRKRKSKPRVGDIKDKETKLRESALKMFKDLFTKYIIPDTTAARTFQLPSDTSIDEMSGHLSSELERELYEVCINNDTGTLNDAYKEKVRVLFSNLKDQKNIDMKTLVINKKLPFNKLVKMSVNELINPDLRHFREKVDNEALDNLVLEQPNRPKYHKTHKGDELIEDPNAYEPEDIIFNRDIVATKLKENSDNDSSHHSDYANSMGSNHDGKGSEENVTSTRARLAEEYWACSLDYKETRTKFRGNIRFLASSHDISNTLRRDAIGDGKFVVEGRLKDEDAEGYIEQMATTRTFLAYALRPLTNYQDSQQSEAFYEFLSSRQRYGALKAKRQYVRHVYVIPYSERHQLGVLKHLHLADHGEKENDLTEGDSFLIVAVVRPDMLDVT